MSAITAMFDTREAALAAAEPGAEVIYIKRMNKYGFRFTGSKPGNAKPATSTVHDLEEHRAKRRAIMVRASDIKERPRVFVFPGLLWEGKHTMIAGLPDQGKSVLQLDIAARITRGGKLSPYSQQEFEPRNVVLASAEDDPADTIVPRLRVAGADLERVTILKGVSNEHGGIEHLDLRAHLNEIRAAVGDTKAVMLGVDPITSYLGRIDSNQGSQVRSVLDPIKEVLEEFRTALLSLNHLNKDEKQSAINRVLGSLSFVGAPRMVAIYLNDPAQDYKLGHRWLLPLKANLLAPGERAGYSMHIVGKDGEPFMEWTGRVDRNVTEVMGASPPTKTERAEAFLVETLSHGVKVSSADIKRMCDERGFGERVRLAALNNIGAVFHHIAPKGAKAGSGFWSLPPDLIVGDEGEEFDSAPAAETVAEAARAPLEAAATKVTEEWLTCTA